MNSNNQHDVSPRLIILMATIMIGFGAFLMWINRDSDPSYDSYNHDYDSKTSEVPDDVEEFLDYKINHAPEGQRWNDN